ncbi:hypothetical protein CYMTET_51796 [Cymbomonas tetramitiformis]|uniref:Integrase catalytic domain-containing protein n=1 Tax=Cymbomonas tetramitiformis TaxID=36881 RepID=A0AAE0BLR9_9CHLO|nr:hypothetical protein CYMTET_51796 [Cymbomonas tetramitiformis]
MASTPYQLMAPARLRAHPAGASKRQLQFDQLVATPVAALSQQSAAEKKFDSDSAAFLDDHQKIEALVRGIKSKLCGKGDAIDEWRFCGDESNARSLLDSLVEELTSRLTRFNPLFAHAFRLSDATATVMPTPNKLLKELLEYLCGGPALASVREAHRYFPDDGKVILTALVRDVMPDLEDFDKTDFIFTPTVEVPAGVNPKQFIKAFTDAVSNASTDLGQHSSLDISREDAVRLFLRRTCPVTYKQVHEDYAIEKVKTQADLTLGISRKGKGKGKGKGKKGKGKSQKTRVTFHPGSKQFMGNCWSCGGRHRQADCTHMQHLAAHSMRLDPEALAEGAFTDVLTARFQAAYEHSEEAFQAVCWEHGTPDICDSSESVCTYPDDGSMSFAAYLTQGDEDSHAPAWAPQEWTDSEWDAWETDSYTQEQHEEWDRLQRKASAKFQAFCFAGEEADYNEQDLQEPYSSLSLGRVHFYGFGVGGVDRDTTHTPPVVARMDSAPAVAPLDSSSFYRADPSIACSPCDPQPASIRSRLDAGVMLCGAAQTLDHAAAVSGDTPDDAEHGDTCLHPVSALFAHEASLEPSSGLFADMVLAGDLRFQSMTEQHRSEKREEGGAWGPRSWSSQLESVTGPEPSPPVELRLSLPSRVKVATPPGLTDREQDHWDRLWCEDHTQPTRWHDTLPASAATTPRVPRVPPPVMPFPPGPGPCFVPAGAGLYATATDPPASGHGVPAGSVVEASDETDDPEPRGSGEGQHYDPPPSVTSPTLRRGVGRGGVPFYRHALVSTLVVLGFLGCAMADVDLLQGQEDASDRLRLLSPGGPRGGAQGTGTGILYDWGSDGGTWAGNNGNSGSCDWEWSDSGTGHSSSGSGTGDSHSDHGQFPSSGMPPDAASQIQLFRSTITDNEDRRRRSRHLTALALATFLAIIIQCLFLFFMDFQSISGDSTVDRGVGGVSPLAWQQTGSVLETTSHLAHLMITVGGAVVHMSWWLGFTWTAHGTPPPGLVFTCSPVISAYTLSRDGDGIVVDSGATGNITGTRSRISALDTSATIGFSTVMTGPVSRTDGTCTLHLYGREILSGEIDEYTIPGCHFKEGARTLLSTRVMLRHGFSSPDFITMTYTHLDSGRTYRITDNQVDYLWDEPQRPHSHHFGSAAVRTRTGDSSDWQWSNSEYTKWATTHGSPTATAKLGTPAFDVSMYGDSLPVGEGNNHPALEHWSISDDCHTKQWTGQFFYGNIPFSISMIDRMLTKGNHDFLLDPHNTTYFWIVPYMPQHQIWHKTCTMEVLHIYPKGSKRIFSFSRKHTYASSHPLTPAGSDGGPDRVFIDGTPFEICILFRNRNTPVRVSPFVEFHAVMGHGSTASLLKLYDLPGIQLGRPLLSRRAIAAMPTCSQFCAVCCTSKLKQKPCGHHDQLRSVAIQPGQKWAADLTGPITPAGYNGHLYRCQFIDYVSRFIFVYTFVQKSEYYTCLVHFYGSLHAMGYAPQSITLRTDCAPEMGDPQCVAFYQKHRILHQKSSPTIHTDNPHAENAIGKISDMAKALLLAAGMPEDYWPLAATHAGFIWNISTHKNISTTPFHQIRGYHYGYAKLKAFGQNCYVIMSQQQRNSRQPGMSRKSQRAAWLGRLVGVSVSSLAYKILDTETNMIHYVGKPHWIHNHQDMGEILGSFPDPHQAEREFDASYDRPQPFSDSFDTAGSRVHGIGSFFDGEESHACVQLIQADGTVTWTMAVRYVLQTSDGRHYRDLLHYLDCYRKLNGINEHYPIWTIVKARQTIRAPIYSAILISTHRGNRRPYGVILEPCTDEPAGWHIDLPANLIIFPSTHSAAYLPFSDTLSSDLRAEYMFGSFSSMEQFLSDAPTSTITHMLEVSAPEIKLPHGVRQALSSPQSEDWLKAMDQEVGDMVNQEKLKLGTPPANAQYLTTLFVLSMPFKPDPTGAGKPYQIFKARMAGDGSRTTGYLPWETSSATPEISAFRLLFIFAALFQLVVSHLDVSQAFMHAKLEFPVWIQFPSGYTFKGYSYALLSYALSIAENIPLSQKIKHVLVRFHMLRDFIRLGWIICWRVPSEKNLADPYTKPVPPAKNTVPYFNMLFDSYMDMQKAVIQAARSFGFSTWRPTQKAAA